MNRSHDQFACSYGEKPGCYNRIANFADLGRTLAIRLLVRRTRAITTAAAGCTASPRAVRHRTIPELSHTDRIQAQGVGTLAHKQWLVGAYTTDSIRSQHS